MLRKLISGTDIRGVAVSAQGQEATLLPEVVRRFGRAFAQLTAERLDRPVETLRFAVGRDSRVTGPSLAAAMLEGLMAEGAQVLDCAMCTTPAMFMATRPEFLDVDGAVMITASHHPWTRNGCKFFWKTGGLDHRDIEALAEMAEALPDAGETGKTAPTEDLLRRYCVFLRGIFQRDVGSEQPLKGLHAVVDAGGGAGGFYAELLASLGADTTGSQLLEPDGKFQGHVPNPEDKAAMDSVSAAVLRAKAQVGIIFDADCDRAAMVDGEGQPINRNRLVALTSAMVLRGSPGATIVTDSVTSLGLRRYIAALGGVHYRYKRGYRNVIDEAIRLNAEGTDCPLAIETSGHAALRENFFLDDGMYLVTRLLIFLMQEKNGESELPIARLLEALPEPLESVEIRLSIEDVDFTAVGQRVLSIMEEGVRTMAGCKLATDSKEGVRLLFDLNGQPEAGFVMLRRSVHDPVLVINAESDMEGGLKAMLGKVYGLLDKQPGVDWTLLRESV